MKTHQLLGLLAICTLATQGQAQTAVGSTLSVGAYADANQQIGGSVQDFINLSQGNTLNTLTGSRSVTDQDTVNTGHWLRVQSSATAQWSDAGHGSVAWRGMGWQHNTISNAGAKLNGFVSNQPVWTYTFISTANTTFTMNYDVRATGDPFGLLGAVIQWSGVGGNLDLTNAYTPVASGAFVRQVQSGQMYTVGLYNMGNVFSSPYANTRTAMMDADFNWHVGTVPEPTSILALASGLGVIVIRRRRR